MGSILPNESARGPAEGRLAHLEPSDLPGPPQLAAAILRALHNRMLCLSVRDAVHDQKIASLNITPIGRRCCSRCEDIDLTRPCLYIADDSITEARLEEKSEQDMAGRGRLLDARQALLPARRMERVKNHIAPRGRACDDDTTLLVVCPYDDNERVSTTL